MSVSKSARVRARLDHPIVDSDRHPIEFEPALLEYLRDLAGPSMVERYRQASGDGRASSPTRNTLDRATASLPRLLASRLEELGIDFSIVYPSLGLVSIGFEDGELRRATCRAANAYHADLYRDYARWLTPAAIIPMHSPQEAIAELHHAVGELGMKAVMLADGPHDYGPVWARCVDLGVCPTFHTGHFAAVGEATCKSLLLGGVPRRFPQLRFAFLEGGVAWARALFAQLLARWEKGSRRAVLARGDEIDDDDPLDEFRACGIEGPRDLHDLFVPRFYFGCAANDPMNAWAFDARTNPFGAKLHAIFGSEIGHWDVREMREVVQEGWELVERGLVSKDDFRAFTFENPVRFWTALAPDFFDGTSIESAARALIRDAGC